MKDEIKSEEYNGNASEDESDFYCVINRLLSNSGGPALQKINEQMLKNVIFPCHHLWKQQANNNNKTFCQISVMGKNKKRIDI